jgi:hypothetical protein
MSLRQKARLIPWGRRDLQGRIAVVMNAPSPGASKSCSCSSSCSKSGVWGGGVLEYCACGELHPPRRIEGAHQALRSRASKEPGVACPRPGGEPLCSLAALWVGSRRLPGTTQRSVLPIASIPCGGYNRPIELPHLETFPGAACLPTHRAAKLQSGSPPGVRSAATVDVPNQIRLSMTAVIEE